MRREKMTPPRGCTDTGIYPGKHECSCGKKHVVQPEENAVHEGTNLMFDGSCIGKAVHANQTTGRIIDWSKVRECDIHFAKPPRPKTKVVIKADGKDHVVIVEGFEGIEVSLG